MTTNEQALRMALEALEESRDDVCECLNQLMPNAGFERYDRRIAAYQEQLIKHDASVVACKEALAAPQEPKYGWLIACDEELVCAHLGVAELSHPYEYAKGKLLELIQWHVVVATDPAVNGGFSLQPVAAPQGEPLQHFESPDAKQLMAAWMEGWDKCRDAEYVGEEAQNDAFNNSNTLNDCINADQAHPAPTPHTPNYSTEAEIAAWKAGYKHGAWSNTAPAPQREVTKQEDAILHNALLRAGKVVSKAAPAYPLPDSLYPDSKDWMAGGYAERVEWLHSMYENARDTLDEYLDQAPAPLSNIAIETIADQHLRYQMEGPESSGVFEFARANERHAGMVKLCAQYGVKSVYDLIDAMQGRIDRREHEFDRAFLDWCADRMVYVYGADPHVDFVLKLRRMAGSRP